MTTIEFISTNGLTINMVASTIVLGVAAKLFLMPRLTTPRAIVAVLLLHAMRHEGLMFISVGATLGTVPPGFALPAAFGDFATAVLAFTAIPFVLRGSALAPALVWLFNGFGTLDLLYAVAAGHLFGVPPFLGAAYWIPMLLVPLLLVTHFLTFVVLVRGLPKPMRP